MSIASTVCFVEIDTRSGCCSEDFNVPFKIGYLRFRLNSFVILVKSRTLPSNNSLNASFHIHFDSFRIAQLRMIGDKDLVLHRSFSGRLCYPLVRISDRTGCPDFPQSLQQNSIIVP